MTLRFIRLGILGIAIGLGLVGGMAYYINHQRVHFNQDGKRQLPDLGGPFTLTDQFGTKRTDREFQGKYRLMYFGYTCCPDVCPLGLRNISQALELLGRDLDQIVPLFITIDPERDTLQALQSYASTVHSSFVFLTGTKQELDPVLKAYNVYAAKTTSDGTLTDYVMDHSSLIYLMDKEGKLVDFFPHTESPQKIAATLQRHLLKDLQHP
jgi:cytochrome oxidase Cu insertion factor (SCO1/SenC/PrrC family)